MEKLKILQIDDTCTGCGACSSICPKSCISIEPNNEGFYYPTVDNEKCIKCHLCERACHVLNPYSEEPVVKDGFIVYKSNNDNIREKSTSGGAFSLLADNIIKRNGVVFGSLYNSADGKLEVNNSDNCNWLLFRKSKYVETYTGHTFNDVIKFLKAGRPVLYCSTPCQIRGLKQLLKIKKIDDSGLITIDLICHGVPSMAFFKYFLTKYNLEDKEILELNFRHKDFSDPNHMWHSQAIVINYKDGSRRILPDAPPINYDYYYSFDKNISLRKSCYSCNYPQYSYADFTIADFWGVTNFNAKIDDNKGLSLIKINTQKAQNCWDSLIIDGFQQKLDYKDGKYVYEKIDKRPYLNMRNKFYKIASTEGYNRAVIKFYWKKILEYHVKKLIKTIIRRK